MSRGFRAVLAAALILAAASFLLSSYLFTRLAATTSRTTDALCTFRADVERRAGDGEKFLHDHPQGIPGIPIGTLRQSIDGQRRTVKTLATLDCPPPFH